jgi:hypothetical protein
VHHEDPQPVPETPGNFAVYSEDDGDRGSAVVKVLCYKSEGRWFDQSAVSSGRVRSICNERAVRKECLSAFCVHVCLYISLSESVLRNLRQHHTVMGKRQNAIVCTFDM